MENGNLKTHFSKVETESATGERFELYAHYLLNLIHPTYIGTRIHKDGGVDGMILHRSIKRKKPPVFYSIYGPERTTGWTRKFAKIKKDVASIQLFAKDKFSEFTITFVTNFKLESNEITTLDSFMEKEGISYAFFDPDKLFTSLLGGPAQITNAVAFIEGMEKSDRELTDWNNHVFAGEVLKILHSFDEKEDLSAKMKRILQMRMQLITYLSPDDFIVRGSSSAHSETEKAEHPLFVLPNANVLKRNTQVNQGCTTVYLIHSRSQKVQRLSKNAFNAMNEKKLSELPTVFPYGQNIVAVKIEDLSVIYFILSQSFHQFEQKGESDLYELLLSLAQKEEKMFQSQANQRKSRQ